MIPLQLPGQNAALLVQEKPKELFLTLLPGMFIDLELMRLKKGEKWERGGR